MGVWAMTTQNTDSETPQWSPPRRIANGVMLNKPTVLSSGLVRNDAPDGKRSHLTAFVSDDDGATWKGGLLLDERESSYPDGVQGWHHLSHL